MFNIRNFVNFYDVFMAAILIFLQNMPGFSKFLLVIYMFLLQFPTIWGTTWLNYVNASKFPIFKLFLWRPSWIFCKTSIYLLCQWFLLVIYMFLLQFPTIWGTTWLNYVNASKFPIFKLFLWRPSWIFCKTSIYLLCNDFYLWYMCSCCNSLSFEVLHDYITLIIADFQFLNFELSAILDFGP